MKKTLFSFILTVLSICSFAQNTVVDIIVNSTEHDTLEAAVVAAELADDYRDLAHLQYLPQQMRPLRFFLQVQSKPY